MRARSVLAPTSVARRRARRGGGRAILLIMIIILSNTVLHMIIIIIVIHNATMFLQALTARGERAPSCDAGPSSWGSPGSMTTRLLATALVLVD